MMLLWTNEPLTEQAVTIKPYKIDFTPTSGKRVDQAALGWPDAGDHSRHRKGTPLIEEDRLRGDAAIGDYKFLGGSNR
jgi:hypothetical protein